MIITLVVTLPHHQLETNTESIVNCCTTEEIPTRAPEIQTVIYGGNPQTAIETTQKKTCPKLQKEKKYIYFSLNVLVFQERHTKVGFENFWVQPKSKTSPMKASMKRMGPYNPE